MSNKQREEGTIQLNQTGFRALAKQLRALYNAHVEYHYACAVALHALVQGQSKRDRAANRFVDLCTERRIGDILCYRVPGVPQPRDTALDLKNLLRISSELYRGKNAALCKPRKATFKTLTSRDWSFTLHMDEWSLHVDPEQRTLTWHIEENNHSVDEARSHPLVKAVLTLLNQHKWGRGETGIFYYTDEHYKEVLDGDESVCTGLYGQAQKNYEAQFSRPNKRRRYA
ncbi:hypothetical protein [Ferrimonas marina]|uniref:Uncharacterized protein n=1 Tax=Ferrimonas marina TaxID=299255 RepID=A0A1M5U936_9GAMM|nr:hypothetical protein [Ferrimonas marina]SHH59459.1 hypothetical protein SAMN02745129_2459 [Ferrimonas marina]